MADRTPPASELDPLIVQARGADLPSAERLARVRARLFQPAPPTGGEGGSSGAASAAKVTPVAGWSVGAWVSSIVGVGVALVGALYLGTREPQLPAARPRPVVAPLAASAPQPQPPAAAPVESPAVAAPEPARPAERVKRAVAAREPASPKDKPPAEVPSTFSEEVSLLQAAIVAHQHADKERARKLLAEHEQRFPDSQLAKERARLSARIEQ